VQQEKRRRVFRSGLSVKDGEPIYLCRAIKRQVFHGTFLSLGLGQLVHAERCAAVGPYITEPLLPRHLENDFQLDRGAERKACDAIHQAARALVFAEDILQQLRGGVSDGRLIADISRSGHRHAESDDPRHFVERSQMLLRDSEDVERREVSRLAPRFHIELRADTPNEFRPVAFRGKHPAQKKQIARLHRFHIGAERLRRRRELDAKFFQPLLGAGWP
jgi:hypothetical protein